MTLIHSNSPERTAADSLGCKPQEDRTGTNSSPTGATQSCASTFVSLLQGSGAKLCNNTWGSRPRLSAVAASRLKSATSLRALSLSFAMLGVLLLPACKKDQASSKKGTPPAKVEKLPQETEISLITLTEQAEQRLGISLTTVSHQPIQQRRTFGGEVTIPGGKSIIVSAPVAGSIAPPDLGSIPLPGQRVKAGAPVLSLVPLLTPERYVPTPAERVQMANARGTLLSALTVAKGDVQRSQAEVDLAKVTLARAEKLLDDKVGSARAVDDAKGSTLR